MNKITITVEGQSGTGKTTIAQQIAGQLEVIGFPVTLVTDGGLRCTTDHLKSMSSIREHGLEIEINEKQLPRV